MKNTEDQIEITGQIYEVLERKLNWSDHNHFDYVYLGAYYSNEFYPNMANLIEQIDEDGQDLLNELAQEEYEEQFKNLDQAEQEQLLFDKASPCEDDGCFKWEGFLLSFGHFETTTVSRHLTKASAEKEIAKLCKTKTKSQSWFWVDGFMLCSESQEILDQLVLNSQRLDDLRNSL